MLHPIAALPVTSIRTRLLVGLALRQSVPLLLLGKKVSEFRSGLPVGTIRPAERPSFPFLLCLGDCMEGLDSPRWEKGREVDLRRMRLRDNLVPILPLLWAKVLEREDGRAHVLCLVGQLRQRVLGKIGLALQRLSPRLGEVGVDAPLVLGRPGG